MKRSLILLFVIFVATGVLSAAGPWSLFDGAMAFNTDNQWAIKLTSNNTTVADSGVAFQQPNGKLLFSQISQLSTDYNTMVGSCGGGSPRFQVTVDLGGGVLKNVFVYIGDAPNFSCPAAASAWQSTGNLIASADKRFDTTHVGGTFYDTFSGALALVGDKPVVYVTLVVDSGWLFGNEVVLVKNVTVNNFVLKGQGFSK
jgi:hypothetical protein